METNKGWWLKNKSCWCEAKLGGPCWNGHLDMEILLRSGLECKAISQSYIETTLFPYTYLLSRYLVS